MLFDPHPTSRLCSFIYSPNMVSQAVEAGLHDEANPVFDFALTFSPSLQVLARLRDELDALKATCGGE